MQNLIFSLNVVSPVFLIILLGIVLKRSHIIDDTFISVSSKVVFNVAMPALVFNEICRIDFRAAFDLKQVLWVYAGTLAVFICAWLLVLLLTRDGRDQGAFIQGSVRSNYAIVGFSIILNMFGSNALSLAAILLAFIMPVYNVLAVVALTAPLNRERHLGALKTLFMIIKNPLILALIVALPFSLSRINVPEALSVAVTYLAKMTLPLALLGIGGSLNFASVKKDWRLALVATILRLIVFPAALTYGAICLGYRGESLGVIFVLFATPTAIASFIMAKAMNSNAELAGNIVLLTTLGSVVTMSLGIFIIRTLGYF